MEVKANATSKDLILDTFLLYEKFCIASAGHGKQRTTDDMKTMAKCTK